MHRLRVEDRDRAMTAIVSFHNVPMPRMVAFAIRDIESDGAPVDVFSADRTTKAIGQHNAQFGTNLSGQAALVALFRAGLGNPANSPNTTSHCYCADASVAALLSRYHAPTQAGRKIPVWAVGIDLADKGKVETVERFLTVAHRLGYRFMQPYASGSERHHVILVSSPIPVLERRNQIAKERHA